MNKNENKQVVVRKQPITVRGRVSWLAVAIGVITFGVFTAGAQTDIISTVASLTTVWNAVQTLAILVLLFVLGRRMLRKA